MQVLRQGTGFGRATEQKYPHKVRTISVIGIGAGDPDYLTVQAIDVLQRVDVFFFIDKGSLKHDLTGLRTEICQRFIPGSAYRIVHADDPERDRAAADYGRAVLDWHERRAKIYEQLISTELGPDGHGAFLVWGDPGLYDGTLRIIEHVLSRRAVHFDYRVYPGISSVQALAARHRIALNRTGEPVLITTGRRLAATEQSEVGNTFVMLDAECTFARFQDPQLDIYWGAYLGTPDEVLMAGALVEVAADIVDCRAALRKRKGWIMDTYLLRRRR